MKQNDSEASIPVDNPQFHAIAKNAFNPVLLNGSLEAVLDGGYNWLEGSADKLDFRIDLTDAKQELATGLGSYVTNRVIASPCVNRVKVTRNLTALMQPVDPKG